jgi:hypothetical protein
MAFLSTKPVGNSVEKQGSLTLSARLVSGPVQIGEKISEIEMIPLNSTGCGTYGNRAEVQSKILQWPSHAMCVSR